MELLKNKTFLISIALWCFITIVRILNHTPWLDEAHAWTIAEQLNLIQIFDFMNVEGHTFIWYLLLMPFAKFHLGYPYVMQFLNWIFCFFSLIILWKKAPFNTLIKCLITFSYPFLFLYSVYARCYSIGIMLLFMLTALFSEKLKRPLLYSVILILCANTSLMAMIGATAFGILFLFDFFKSKPDKKIVFECLSLLFFGAILVLSQIIGVNDSAIDNFKGINFDYNSLIKIFILGITVALISIFPLLLNFRKNIKPLFFICFTGLFLTYIFIFRYFGHYWSHTFYYIYFLITLWLAFDLTITYNKNNISRQCATFVLVILTIFFQILLPNFINEKTLFESSDVKLAKMILSDKKLDNSAIIFSNDFYTPYILLPYKQYNIVNYCEDKSFGYDRTNFPVNNDICFTYKVLNEKDFIYTTIFKTERIADIIQKIKNKDEIYSAIQMDEDAFKDLDIIYMQDERTNTIYSVQRYKCLSGEHLKNICLYKIKKSD